MTDSWPAKPTIMETRSCPRCGFANQADALSCTKCGIQLLAASLVDISSLFTSTLQQLNEPCPKCGHINRIGELVCDHCGAILVNDYEVTNATTNPLGDDDDEPDPVLSFPPISEPPPRTTARLTMPAVDAAPTEDPAFFDDDMVLRVEVAGAPSPIILYPTSDTVIGRRDPVTGQNPDIDLGAYAGYRMGISRRHAVLRLKDHILEIVDLGSSNGTLLNNRQLPPMEPQMLRSGDQLTFGKMLVQVTFVRRS